MQLFNILLFVYFQSYYNVVFFDEKVTRAWISTDNIMKYNREFRYSKEFKVCKYEFNMINTIPL